MELLELVRDLEKTPDAAAPARIARSRAQLLAQLSASSKRRVRTRWVWGGTAAVGGLSAATVVAGVVIAGMVAPVVVQPASAAAVETLNEAAEVVITGVDPTVGPGQYLRIRETYELVSLWDADGAGAAPVGGFNTATLTTSEGAVHVRGVRDLYAPSDRSGDWVLDDRATNEVLDVWGDPRVRAAYEELAELSALPPGTDADPAGIRLHPGGPDDRLRPFYDEMPRDPQQLLDWYRDRLQTSDDWLLFQNIGRGLQTNLMPRDLRAASLRVLGLLNNVDVTATEGVITTLTLPYSLGGGEFGNLLESEIDIDTSTGQIVGVRESYPNRSTSLLPAGVPWASWRIEITVVDEAPSAAAVP